MRRAICKKNVRFLKKLLIFVFQDIANFFQKHDIGRFCGRRFGFFFFFLKAFENPDDYKNTDCDDQKIDDGLYKLTVSDRRFADFDTQIRKIDTADQQTDKRHDDIVYEARNDFSERTADDDTDRHIDDIAAGNEFFKSRRFNKSAKFARQELRLADQNGEILPRE